MSGPEILRRAAEQIRNDHGDVVSRNTRDGRRWLPVADMLDTAAHQHEQIDRSNAWGDIRRTTAHLSDALAVARAYIGEPEDGNWIFEELERAAAEYRATPDEYKPLLLRRSTPPYCSSCGIPHDRPMHYDGGES